MDSERIWLKKVRKTGRQRDTNGQNEPAPANLQGLHLNSYHYHCNLASPRPQPLEGGILGSKRMV